MGEKVEFEFKITGEERDQFWLSVIGRDGVRTREVHFDLGEQLWKAYTEKYAIVSGEEYGDESDSESPPRWGWFLYYSEKHDKFWLSVFFLRDDEPGVEGELVYWYFWDWVDLPELKKYIEKED